MQKITLSLFLWLGLLAPLYAKWAPLADAPSKNSYNQEITVHKDGTLESVQETTKVILTESGRSHYANTILRYNGDSEKVQLLDAKTTYKGKEFKLDRQLIEDKPLASSNEGFDQHRQLLLAFPKTEVGAKLYTKHKFTLKKPPLDNFYSGIYTFGEGELVANARVKINSQLPLYVHVNDPDHYLRITRSKTKNIYSLEIVLTKEIYKSVTDEPGEIIVNHKLIPWVLVSTLEKWEDFAVRQGELVAKVYEQALPKDFVQILVAAKKKNTDVDRINTVTSLLNDKIRYMGDWSTVSGRYIPRDLDKISKTQLGDCKDFSAATVAILTKLGYRAEMAMVMRGISHRSWDILPGFAAFNHMMVKVTAKEGKVYWIDPTNFESMADGIFPDIAAKKVLILNPKHPSYEQIPAIDASHAQTNLERQLTILDNNKILDNGRLLLKNERTLGLIGSTLKVSEDAIKNVIYYALAGYTSLDESNKKGIKLPKLNSRIVQDISCEYSFERENSVLQTNVGPAIKLNYSDSIPVIYNISQDNIADVLVSYFPYTTYKQTTIKNVKVKNIEWLNKEKKTPWISLKRICNFSKDHNLQINDEIILHKNLISSEDFKKPEFIALKKWLKDNFNDVIIVLEENGTKSG